MRRHGNQCTISYTNTAFPRLITKVTDPYNRSAHFIYDNQGRLTNIVDMAGMSSSFKYDTTGAITNLVTPYGTTSFRYYSGTNELCTLNRGIEITEPTGTKQLYVYRDNSPSGATLYQSFDGYANVYRNTFHWNRQQYAALSENAKTNVLDMPVADYLKASLRHWLHGPDTGQPYTVIGTLSASAGPLVNTNDSYRVNMVAFTYPDQWSYAFAGTMNLPSTVSWGGGVNKLEMTRNSWGRPTLFSFYRELGTVTQNYTNQFNADGRILQKVWGTDGQQLRGYGYDSTKTNLLTSVTNALGEVLRYTYDANAHLKSITHPSGLVTTNFYDASGFLRTNIDIGFRTNYYTYANGNRASHTNELGLVRSFLWDSLNRLTSISYPDGTTVSNIYDKLDLVATKDRLGNWTRYAYNALRQMTARTNANGHITLFDYCNCGSPSQITEVNGSSPVITQYAYDIAGRRTNVTYADGYSMNYVYDDPAADLGGGRPARVEDSSGLAVHFGYGDFWALARVGLSHLPDVTADGYLMQRTFDKYGRISQTIDRNGVTVTNGYDVLDRLTNRVVLDPYTLAPRGTNAFVYTARGLTNSVDELGNKTWFVYDAAGRLLSQTNANGEVLQFTYNPSDQLLTLKDGKNQQTSWNYDQYGRVTNKLDATSTEIFRYKYDPNDRLTNRWTREKGDTYYRYDVVGSLTNVDYPGTVMDITLIYDGLDRLTNIVDAIGTTKFSYTAAGQLLSEDGPWASDTVSYTYSARRRASLSVLQPNASPWTQTYGYDDYNRLANVVSAAGTFGYTYWSWATLSDRVQYLGLPGNNTEHTYIESEFDELARLTSTRLRKDYATIRNRHDYQLNDANQRTRQTFTDGNYVDYTYDNIGQLKTAKGYESGGSTARLQEQFGYAYDAAWNLQRRTNNALVQTFGVNNRNELTNATRSGTLTVAGLASEPRGGDQSWGYPAGVSNVVVSGTGLTTGNANLYADGAWAKTNATLADGNNNYTATAYDTYGRTASDSINLSLPATINFQYDGNGNLTNDGRRVFEYDYENQLTNVYVASAWRSAFQYDAFGRRRVRKEYGWSGSAWTLTNEVRYVYDGMLVVQERDANNLALVSYTRGNDLSGTRQGAGGIGGLLSRTDMPSTINPQLSTSSHAYYHADGNGNITALVDMNGFVVARYQYDPYGNLLGMAGPLAEANTYRFSSKEWHANSGLYYYGFRFYEPNLQRWLNRDPIEEEGGINLYGFVANNPINTVDRFGHGWVKKGLQACNAAAELEKLNKKRKSLQRAVKSLEKQIAEHKQKLSDYLKDPDKYDNKGFLRDAPPDRRQKIIAGRKEHLENEIRNFEKQVADAQKELQDAASAAALLGSAACTLLTPHVQELTDLEKQGGQVPTSAVISASLLDIGAVVDPGILDLIEWIIE